METEPKYMIQWKGPYGWETIDYGEDGAENQHLINEYRLAFNGGQFRIKKNPEYTGQQNKWKKGRI